MNHNFFISFKDIYLFNEIRNWETDVFKQKNLEQRAQYLKELKEKLTLTENEFQKIPYLNLYKQKKNRFQSDIEQINWRLNYLKKVS